jgi:site-specific recombinase XerD
MATMSCPLPLFDSRDYLLAQKAPDNLTPQQQDNFLWAQSFLMAYEGSEGTFNAYRREVERLLHWTWLIQKIELTELKREQIEQYLYFCQAPPFDWIGTHKPPRFILKEGERIANPIWRPFVAHIDKHAHKQGLTPQIKQFEFSQASLRETIAILGSFFNYLIQDNHTNQNPIALIRQKSKFLQKYQPQQQSIRRLSQKQWTCLIHTVENLAQLQPEKHERSLFILSALFLMYLRLSELCASSRWIPKMSDFHKDHQGLWWFKTLGKGNKIRDIAVSDSMLEALKRWRTFLGLSALPHVADNTVLLPKIKGKGPISSVTYLREMIQFSFDAAIDVLKNQNEIEEADGLEAATAHWLRHTGISEDVKIRPREHVRDDAGHSSGAITDKYIDVERVARHESARHKEV